jgi:hypothetical protein
MIKKTTNIFSTVLNSVIVCAFCRLTIIIYDSNKQNFPAN